MKKLLFYGGTFNPPHSGHLHLLRQALRLMHFDKIIIMPTAVPPHKQAAHYLSDEQRLKATSMLFADIRGAMVSDWEINKGGKSYSIETISYLTAQYPEYEIYFLMGSDMFLSFESWYQFEKLANMCTLIVASRDEEDREKLKPMAQRLEGEYGAKCIMLSGAVYKKSSTEVREGGSDDDLSLEIRYYLYGASALDSLFEYLKQQLTPEKYEHSLRVAEYALKLAKIHGADEGQVYLASLLHDVTKCWGKKKQLDFLHKKHYKLTYEDRQAPQIFHQISGALFARDHFGVKDKQILQAIKCHTTGKEKMTILDKILFLADSIEPARKYGGVEQMRSVAAKDLDQAVLMNFDRSIAYIVEKGFFLHPQTVAARNWMLKVLAEKTNHYGG